MSAPVIMSAPVKQSSSTKHKCYVIRGGEKQGVYNVWSDAVN